jgi:flagellar motor switch protein FliG
VPVAIQSRTPSLPEYAMSKDEIVNGLEVAAAILNRMNPAQKERIVKAMQTKSPEIAAKIEEKLFSFDMVLELTGQSVQILLTHVSPDDLLLSLKTASKEAKDHLLSNLSERRRTQIIDELLTLPLVRASEVEGAQRRIITKIDELQRSGVLRTRGTKDIYV